MSLRKTQLFFSLFIMTAITLTFLTSGRAYALEPGCYERSAGTNKYVLRDCPEDKVADVASGICFFKIVAPKQGSNYMEGDCNSVSQSQVEGANFLNPAGNDCNANSGDCITSDIQMGIDFLAAGVGVIITIMIVFGGLQYITSRDNPQAVQAAKSKIINAVIAMFAFIFVYAFIQWVVPGGAF